MSQTIEELEERVKTLEKILFTFLDALSTQTVETTAVGSDDNVYATETEVLALNLTRTEIHEMIHRIATKGITSYA